MGARQAVPASMDTVRGLACLMIVALHVVGDTGNNGLHLPMTSDWHYAMKSIEFLRIPLFTALSGYLYAGSRVTTGTFLIFWRKKIRRLGVPLVFVTLVVWFLRGRAYGDETTLSHALLFAYAHLWYIQALILLFLLISIADSLFRPGFIALILAGLAAVMVAQAGVPLPQFLSIYGVFYLGPYFLFGILLRTHTNWLADERAGSLALGICAIVLAAQQFGLFGLTAGVDLLQLPAAIAGMAGVVFLLQRMPVLAPLAAVGRYAYTIYLWHVLASATVRGMLLKAGFTNLPVIFACCFVAGVLVPIALYQVFRRIPYLSVAITGDHAMAQRSVVPSLASPQLPTRR